MTFQLLIHCFRARCILFLSVRETMSHSAGSIHPLDPDHNSCIGGQTVKTCRSCAGNAPRSVFFASETSFSCWSSPLTQPTEIQSATAAVAMGSFYTSALIVTQQLLCPQLEALPAPLQCRCPPRGHLLLPAQRP